MPAMLWHLRRAAPLKAGELKAVADFREDQRRKGWLVDNLRVEVPAAAREDDVVVRATIDDATEADRAQRAATGLASDLGASLTLTGDGVAPVGDSAWPADGAWHDVTRRPLPKPLVAPPARKKPAIGLRAWREHQHTDAWRTWCELARGADVAPDFLHTWDRPKSGFHRHDLVGALPRRLLGELIVVPAVHDAMVAAVATTRDDLSEAAGRDACAAIWALGWGGEAAARALVAIDRELRTAPPAREMALRNRIDRALASAPVPFGTLALRLARPSPWSSVASLLRAALHHDRGAALAHASLDIGEGAAAVATHPRATPDLLRRCAAHADPDARGPARARLEALQEPFDPAEPALVEALGDLDPHARDAGRRLAFQAGDASLAEAIARSAAVEYALRAHRHPLPGSAYERRGLLAGLPVLSPFEARAWLEAHRAQLPAQQHASWMDVACAGDAAILARWAGTPALSPEDLAQWEADELAFLG